MFQKVKINVSIHGDTKITACDEDMIFQQKEKSWYFISIYIINYLYTYIYNISIFVLLQSTQILPSSLFPDRLRWYSGKYRDYITLQSTRVYLDRPFLFPDCHDIGYYSDNIRLESTRVYLDRPFLFPESDNINYLWIELERHITLNNQTNT